MAASRRVPRARSFITFIAFIYCQPASLTHPNSSAQVGVNSCAAKASLLGCLVDVEAPLFAAEKLYYGSPIADRLASCLLPLLQAVIYFIRALRAVAFWTIFSIISNIANGW